MKTIGKSITIALVIGAVGFAAAVSLAEEISSQGPVPFSAYDTDGSNSINEQEFDNIKNQWKAVRTDEGRLSRGAADAPAFCDLDTNDDGQLSKEELTAGQQSQQKKRGLGHRGTGRGSIDR